MAIVKILDCTLRDGGYVNNFNFGEEVITSIISKLADSNVEMIECGFLSDIETYNANKTFFPTLETVKKLIGKKNPNILYVGMIALGEKEISGDKIPVYDGSSIDAIRITFHKNEIDRGIDLCTNLMTKGYKVFMQPIGTMSYSDEELLNLIKKINEINPYAFAIVDTLGTMYQNDLMRLFYLFDHNLNDNIIIGFHSHNNLQLSFTNAQALLQLQTKREIVIDTSVFGMGRGAGNLCTELLTQYINDNIEYRYDVIPLLEIVDEHLSLIHAKFPWGYSVPYYLSATHDCHPNYASHLLNKQTVSVKVIDCLLKQIPLSERIVYNKNLIENIYIAYQNREVDDKLTLQQLSAKFNNRAILVMAPGKSIEEESVIREFLNAENPIVISVNFNNSSIMPDYVFMSNAKRYDSLRNDGDSIMNFIFTSNIKIDNLKNNFFIVNYSSLLNDNPSISDNAGMMLLTLLKHLDVQKIFLAGFDGFTTNKIDNYYKENMVNNVEGEELTAKNDSIKKIIDELKQELNIKFLTKSIYE